MTLYKKRERFSGLSARIGSAFSRLGLSPNQWTIVSLVPVILAVYFLSQSDFITAALLFLLSSFLDLVDGSVARFRKMESRVGAYLDTVVDRYVEGIIILGLVFAGLPAFLIPGNAWLFLYLFGSIMTTYVKAAAKEKDLTGKEIRGGLLERAERLVILFIGILLASLDPLYLTYVVALLAVLTNLSALQRIRIALNIARK
jgi:archaetidylinositol phosphate synthase